jgi:putative transposase
MTGVLLRRREQQNMKKSRFSEEQIIGILREVEGTSVKAVCARHNICAATYYGWKAKFGGMDVNEARRLRALEDENRRLKNLVADQAVQISILKEVNSKKWKARRRNGGRSSTWSRKAKERLRRRVGLWGCNGPPIIATARGARSGRKLSGRSWAQ